MASARSPQKEKMTASEDIARFFDAWSDGHVNHWTTVEKGASLPWDRWATLVDPSPDPRREHRYRVCATRELLCELSARIATSTNIDEIRLEIGPVTIVQSSDGTADDEEVALYPPFGPVPMPLLIDERVEFVVVLDRPAPYTDLEVGATAVEMPSYVVRSLDAIRAELEVPLFDVNPAGAVVINGRVAGSITPAEPAVQQSSLPIVCLPSCRCEAVDMSRAWPRGASVRSFHLPGVKFPWRIYCPSMGLRTTATVSPGEWFALDSDADFAAMATAFDAVDAHGTRCDLLPTLYAIPTRGTDDFVGEIGDRVGIGMQYRRGQ